MRTTVNLDEKIYRIIRQLAEQNHSSMGKIISDMDKKAISSEKMEYLDSSFPFFQVSENAPVLTLDDIKKNEDIE